MIDSGRCEARKLEMSIPAVPGTAEAVRLPQDRLKGLPREVQHSDGKAGTGTDSPRREGPLKVAVFHINVRSYSIRLDENLTADLLT